MTQAPLHDVTQYCSTGLVEASGEVIHFLARRRVQAAIRADAGAWHVGWWSRRCVHRCPSVSMDSMREHLASLLPIDYNRDRSRLCKARSTCQSWWPRYTITPTMTPVAIHRPV